MREFEIQIEQEWVSDCFLTRNEQFISYIKVITKYIPWHTSYDNARLCTRKYI